MARIYLSLLLYLLCASALSAQEQRPLITGEGTFLTIGLGFPIYTVRDKINSPLAYRGRAVNIRLEAEWVRENWLSQVRLAFSAGSLRAKVKPKRDINKPASLADLRLGFGWYRNLGTIEPTSESAQYAGLSFMLNMDDRDYPLPTNNTGGQHYRISARAGVLDRRGLGNNTRWALTSQVDVPFLTKLYRSSYIGLAPFLHKADSKGRDFWRGMDWVGPRGFLGMEARFAVDYRAQDFRSDRIEYAFWLGYTPKPAPKSLLFTAGQLSYAYRAKL